MKNSPLKNMYPLALFKDEEFDFVCEFIYNATKCSGFNQEGCSYIKKGIKEVLRCFGLRFKPSRISEKAFNSAEWSKIKKDLNDDLFKKWYRNRTKYYPLFLEHIIPLGSLIEKCNECKSLEEVKNVLSELEFVIISKKENDELIKKDYNSKGRETLKNAENAYKDCKIKLMPIEK